MQVEVTEADRFSLILFYVLRSVQYKAVTKARKTDIHSNHFYLLSYTHAIKIRKERGDKS